MESVPQVFPPWMRGFLILAGVYNLAWGLFIYNFPTSFYSWLTKTVAQPPEWIVYQGLGVMVLGTLYLLSASYPVTLWFLVLLGIFSKVVGATGSYIFIMNLRFTKSFIFHLIMNDLIWLIPLSIIANKAYSMKYNKA